MFLREKFYPARELDSHVRNLRFLRESVVDGRTIAAFWDKTAGGYWLKGPLGKNAEIGYVYLGHNPGELMGAPADAIDIAETLESDIDIMADHLIDQWLASQGHHYLSAVWDVADPLDVEHGYRSNAVILFMAAAAGLCYAFYFIFGGWFVTGFFAILIFVIFWNWPRGGRRAG